ncbi:MAG: ABC transporter ATP-binding protein, partial [Eubacterium sp.]|nr:ABC transporter ATP-binding protein [Eubacterium sp.]
MKKTKKKISTKTVWSNNWFGLKEVHSFSKKRIYFSFARQLINYGLWVFYSAYFVKLVLDNIERERPIKEVVVTILIIGAISLILNGIVFYSENVVFPLENIKIYKGIYNKIFRKSENVELNCYDNPEFYNKYTVALDNIGDKLSANVDNVTEIIGGIVGGIIAFKTMIEIDPITILFLIAPLIGNFYFAPKINGIAYNRYKDGVPYDRRIEYVNRVMYLEKYSKELRLYNIFNVLKNMLNDASIKKSNIWKKYFNKAFIFGVLQYVFSYVIIFEGVLLYGSYRALASNPRTITFAEMAVLTSVMVMASWVWVRIINAYNRS